jgi:outer membrane protein assembly factor BamD
LSGAALFFWPHRLFPQTTMLVDGQALKWHIFPPRARGISRAMNVIRTLSRKSVRAAVLPVVALLPLLAACGGGGTQTPSNEPTGPVGELYNNGVDALNARRFSTADDQFNAVQQNYPYSTWAVNAQLMSAYSLYLQNKYTDAIGALDRFIQLHPAHRDIAYVYYLRALCYYEQIADIQRDQKGTQQAMNALQEVVTRFPDTSFAQDAKLKIDLCVDHLAGKEMEIGRYYQKQHLYEAAIGRFQRVVDDFQTTNHVPEALARLTEIYLVLGLKDQARKTAAVLGYNYPGNEWYSDTYAQLVDSGVTEPDSGGPTPVKPPPRGFFSRAWHAVF